MEPTTILIILAAALALLVLPLRIGEGSAATLTPETVEQLSNGIRDATESLQAAQQRMDDSNKKVGDLLPQFEEARKHASENQAEVKRLKGQLEEQAARMETIAAGYTDTINTLRTQMKQLGHSGQAEDTAFIYRGNVGRPSTNGGQNQGSIFRSRQEALEIGMYLMATMKREGEARLFARKWLQEHKKDLRYLPNIPRSFVSEMGDEWLAQMQKRVHNGITYDPHAAIMRQDLTAGNLPGAVFVRPEFSDTLIRNVEQYGVFRQDATIWPMGSDTVYIPRRKSGVTVHWEGEEEQASGTDPKFEMLGMTCKKMFMLNKFSSELDEDAAVSLADIFMFEYALAIAREEDRIGFNGDGSGGNEPGFAGFVGVFGAAGTTDLDVAAANKVPFDVVGAAGNNLTSEITQKKLREMTGVLPGWAETGAAWYAHRTVHADLDGIETTGGGPVVQYREGTGLGSIMGYPRRRVDLAPKAADIGAGEYALALGNLRMAMYLGDRRRMTVETSEHFAFDTDQITTRVTARAAFKVIHGDALVRYKTGTA